MNYYIQGDAANAERIKAAFEENGYKTADTAFNDKDLYYATFHGDVYIIATDCLCYEFFKRLVELGDYKELELPVQPNFKVGDKISWINHDCDTQTITDIRDGSYITVDKHGIRCALKFEKQDEWELVPPKPHYDIANFHAGMPVLVRDDRQKKWCYALYSHYDNEDSYQFVTAGDNPYIQCIPFEGNEHLLGTTDMCDECYINW